MPYAQFLLQDLQGRLRYFTLQEPRFFPFHYPNAVALLFYGSLSSYRLYIIAFTGAAAFLVSRVVRRFGSGCLLYTSSPKGEATRPMKLGGAPHAE